MHFLDMTTLHELDALVGTKLTVDNVFETREAFRKSRAVHVAELDDDTEPLKTKLRDAMVKFLMQCPEETDLRPGPDYLESFLGLRQRIIEEKVSTLNDSLRRLEYRPGQRIELAARPLSLRPARGPGKSDAFLSGSPSSPG